MAKMNAAKKKAPSETRLGRIELILEDVQTQVRSLAEYMVTSNAELKREISDTRAELLARIEVLESVVRQNSEDIRKNSEDIRKNSEDIRKNSEDIRKNSEDIRKQAQAIEEMRLEIAGLRTDLQLRATQADVQRLEGRVAALEQRLGL